MCVGGSDVFLCNFFLLRGLQCAKFIAHETRFIVSKPQQFELGSEISIVIVHIPSENRKPVTYRVCVTPVKLITLSSEKKKVCRKTLIICHYNFITTIVNYNLSTCPVQWLCLIRELFISSVHGWERNYSVSPSALQLVLHCIYIKIKLICVN